MPLPITAAVDVADGCRHSGLPPDWGFYGRKTAAYRQIGNAFPPPVARAVGITIRLAIQAARESVGSGRQSLLRAV